MEICLNMQRKLWNKEREWSVQQRAMNAACAPLVQGAPQCCLQRSITDVCNTDLPICHRCWVNYKTIGMTVTYAHVLTGLIEIYFILCNLSYQSNISRLFNI
jgi:hypothetical protein